MKQQDFSLALNALLPGCDPNAAVKWPEFAAECVDREQYAHFIPAEHDAAGKIFRMAAGDVRDSYSLMCGVNFSHREPVHRWLDGVRGDCSLIMAAQILSAETCSPVGCGICHSINKASNRRGRKSLEAQTLGQTGKAPRQLAVSTSTPKPRVESSNLSAPARKTE